MTSTDTSLLLSLPTELLQFLPSFLHDIEDFKNLSSTCQTLRDALASTTPQTILRLCAAASRIFFRPDPVFLVAACAKELNTWLSSSDINVPIFKEACQGGFDGLLELCLGDARCGLSMAQIRELYFLRMSTIYPVCDLIDKCIGTQWYATPNFWNGGVSDAYTIYGDPLLSLFHLSIYGNLFGPAIDTYIRSGVVPLYAQMDCRAAFVSHCIPIVHDFWVNTEGERCNPPKTQKRMQHENRYYPELGHWKHYQHQQALLHLLNSTRFNRAWVAMSQQLDDERYTLTASRSILDDEFDRDGVSLNRDRLRRACFLYTGMQGLRELARTGLGEYGQKVMTLDADFAANLKDLSSRIPGLPADVAKKMKPDEEQYPIDYGWRWDKSTCIWPDLVGDLASLRDRHQEPVSPGTPIFDGWEEVLQDHAQI